MKDFLGREINVGSVVFYAESTPRSPKRHVVRVDRMTAHTLVGKVLLSSRSMYKGDEVRMQSSDNILIVDDHPAVMAKILKES